MSTAPTIAPVNPAAERARMLARMKNVAKSVRGDDPVRRLHLIVSMDRFLQRMLATTRWGDWILKGGYANQLRAPDEARFTEDVDLKLDSDISRAKAVIVAAAQYDLDDHFVFEVAGDPRPLVGPPGGGLRFVVVVRLWGSELVRFKIDVSSADAIVGKIERHKSDPIVERLGYKRALFPVYPVAQQFAEKLHAYTRPRDVENTRAKDLADMLWLVGRYPFTSRAIVEACVATFGRRGEHPWPPKVSPPPTVWARQYTALRKEMHLSPATPLEAYQALLPFLGPVLASDRAKRWSPRRQAWSRLAGSKSG